MVKFGLKRYNSNIKNPLCFKMSTDVDVNRILETEVISDLNAGIWLNFMDETYLLGPLTLIGLFLYSKGKKLNITDKSKKNYYLIFLYQERRILRTSIPRYIYGIYDITNKQIISCVSDKYKELVECLPNLEDLFEEDKELLECLPNLEDLFEEDKELLERAKTEVIDSLMVDTEEEMSKFEVIGNSKIDVEKEVVKFYKRELKKKTEYSIVLLDVLKNGYPNDLFRKWYKVYLEEIRKEESPKMVEFIDWFYDNV